MGSSEDMVGETDDRLLLLHESDNVLVLLRSVDAGERIFVEGAKVLVRDRLSMGHKLARRQIEQGEKIIKYGAPIGSATQEIAAGEHVHLDNLKSDYIATRQSDQIPSVGIQERGMST